MKEIKKEYIKKNPSTRLYQLDIPIIGLTGGIATGKSTVSKILQQMSFKVIDADQLVKKVYKLKTTIDFIQKVAPECLQNDEIIFPKLREIFFSNKELKKDIENFIYNHLPIQFLNEVTKNDKIIIYDIPLLFEKGLQDFFDVSVLVYCPRNIQINRLIERDKITNELAIKILNAQMSIEEKKLKADFVIDNSLNKEKLAREVEKFLQQVFK